MRHRMHGADRTDQAIAVPERDEAPRLAVRAAGKHPGGRFAPAVFRVEPGPGKDSLCGGIAAGSRGAYTAFRVECPAGDARRLTRGARLVGNCRHDAPELADA